MIFSGAAGAAGHLSAIRQFDNHECPMAAPPRRYRRQRHLLVPHPRSPWESAGGEQKVRIQRAPFVATDSISVNADYDNGVTLHDAARSLEGVMSMRLNA